MQTYNATVRPAGQLTHEVPKFALTAAEIYILRHIHGNDGVVRLLSAKNDPNVQEGPERERLVALYGVAAVSAVFGSAYGGALPKEVPKEWMDGFVQTDPDDESPVVEEVVVEGKRGPGRPKKVVTDN